MSQYPFCNISGNFTQPHKLANSHLCTYPGEHNYYVHSVVFYFIFGCKIVNVTLEISALFCSSPNCISLPRAHVLAELPVSLSTLNGRHFTSLSLYKPFQPAPVPPQYPAIDTAGPSVSLLATCPVRAIVRPTRHLSCPPAVDVPSGASRLTC